MSAESIQEKINALQADLHEAVERSDVAHDAKKNAVLIARDAAMSELSSSTGANGEKVNMWAVALVALLQLRDKESTTVPHFLGPYDVKLLEEHLKSVELRYTDYGHRIAFSFKPNPFFEESELWAEVHDVMLAKKAAAAAEEGSDEEDEEDDGEDSFVFSGITWKEGHGPDDASDDDDEEEEEGEGKGKKRAREGEDVRGPSVLDVFSEMLPHPAKDEGFLEEVGSDEDALADASDDWEEEMSDRRMLLEMFVDCAHDPLAAIVAAEGGHDCEDSHCKKCKTE